MKFSLVLTLLVPAIAAMPAAEDNAQSEVEIAGDSLQMAGCGDGLCRGIQDSKLCNNRVGIQDSFRMYRKLTIEQCKNCSGPSGKYKSGECGGFLWQYVFP